jgi:hypothetical protein
LRNRAARGVARQLVRFDNPVDLGRVTCVLEPTKTRKILPTCLVFLTAQQSTRASPLRLALYDRDYGLWPLSLSGCEKCGLVRVFDGVDTRTGNDGQPIVSMISWSIRIRQVTSMRRLNPC